MVIIIYIINPMRINKNVIFKMEKNGLFSDRHIALIRFSFATYSKLYEARKRKIAPWCNLIYSGFECKN